MPRSEREHLIGTAGAIADDDQIVVIDSQSVLGPYPDAPVALRASMEADLYPRNRPERADLIDGREKDLDFTRELARQGYTHKDTLLERLATVKATASLTRLVQGRIGRDFAR